MVVVVWGVGTVRLAAVGDQGLTHPSQTSRSVWEDTTAHTWTFEPLMWSFSVISHLISITETRVFELIRVKCQ